MRGLKNIILLAALSAVFACEKAGTERDTVTIRDTVIVTDTIVEKDTVETSAPVPTLPGWGSSPVRIGLIGDSISTFAGWIPDGYVAYYPNSTATIKEVEQTYWYRLIYDLMPNAVLDRNIAYSATRLTKSGVGNDKDLNDFITRVEQTGFDNPDIVLIHGGTNDRRVTMETHVPLGEYDYDLPYDELDRFGFRPSYIYLVRKIMELYPGVKIVCIIGDTLNTEKYMALADSIREIAAHYDCPVVNFPYAIDSHDGTHPSAVGAEYMADRIYDVLEKEGLLYYRANR